VRSSFAALLLLAPLSGPAAAESVHAVLDRYPLTGDTLEQWKLPSRLDEISGLALTGDERLLAVDDEEAIVYELDYAEGRLVKAFAFGDPALRGDFEGIAWHDRRVYLVTSGGTIYSAGDGDDGERVPFREHRTELGRDCEVEGLASDPEADRLMILCKRTLRGSDLANPMIFPWSTRDRTVEWVGRIELPREAIEAELGVADLRPSGIARVRTSGHWLIVAALQKALVEIDANGALIAARRLPLAARHRQPEGIELLADGRLLIADEADGGEPRLAVYRPIGEDGGQTP
jgi:uncharacterized protein YjiK